MIVLVLGSGKSGTTYVTKSLIKSGFSGRFDGNAEDLLMRGVNEVILQDYKGKTQSKHPYGFLPDKEIGVTAKHLKLLQNIKRVTKGEHKVLKDPRTTVLHRYWLPSCQAFIGTFRHPHEVTLSYYRDMRRFYDSWEECYKIYLDYWIRFNKSLLYCMENYRGGYLVEFDETINEQLNPIFQELGVKPQFVKDTRRQKPREEEIKNEEARFIYEQLKQLRI